MVPSRLGVAIVAAAVMAAAMPVLLPSARVDAAGPTSVAAAAANPGTSRAHRGAGTAGIAPALRRSPYLTDVSASTATVNFATDTSSPAPIVAWDVGGTHCAVPGQSVAALKTASFSGALSGTTDYQFKAAISGLSPATGYCYRVTQGGVDLLGTSVSFTTAPSPGASGAFRFAVVGDWGVGSSDEAAVFTQIAATNPAFLMTVGDNVYNSGTQTEYGDLNGGNAFAPAYLPKLGSGTPIFPAQGNHGFSGYTPYLVNFPQDAVTAASGGTYAAQSYCCAAGTSGTHTYSSAWYAFTWGNARFYVLEAAWADGNGGYQGDFTDHWNGPVPGCVPCGQEMTWLQNDLAANASVPLKFAFFHYPLHVDNSHQVSDTYLDGPAALEGVLANGGVQIAFNGHAHLYERNLPQIPGRPLVSYVTGGGGDPLGGVNGCSAFDAYAIGSKSSCHAPKPTSTAQVYHFLDVVVNGGQVTVTPINELGQSFDVQTYTYGGSTGPTAPGAPTNVTAVAGNAAALVGWTAPASNGGSSITGYAATASPGGATCATTSTTCTVGSLSNGTTYTFTVKATNAVGTGPASSPSNAVTPAATATAPGAPTNVTAVAGNASALVGWTAPASNGGSSITGYTATASPGGATCATTSTTCTVGSLSNGTTYTFTVKATNAVGTGPASSPSNAVTPTGLTGPPTFTPTADAYVSSGAKTTNFGTASTLQVGTGPTLHSYLMFDVEGLGFDHVNATLRLWTITAGSGASVHGTTTSWTETGINYGNAPSYGGTVSTVSNFAAGAWISYDVTSLVTANGVVTFAYTSASSTPISFASREDAAHAPQLVITP